MTYFNDINVYFHMKNHYRQLKNVKSVVDTSPPQSLLKNPMAMTTWAKTVKGAANEELRRVYTSQNRIPKRRNKVLRKHSCLNTEVKSEANLCTSSKLSTPRGSLSLSSTPRIKSTPCLLEKMPKSRKRSSLPSSSASSCRDSLRLDLVNGTERDDPCRERFDFDTRDDNDYLLFLLRITEDIISNNYYSNKDINKIFKLHVQMNKDRLDMQKMLHHIGNLCQELNIQSSDFNIDTRLNESFHNCQECSTIRTSSLYEMCEVVDNSPLHLTKRSTASLDAEMSECLMKVLEKLSLGRVTECTEPSSSISTIASPKVLYEEKTPVDFDTFMEQLNRAEATITTSEPPAVDSNELITVFVKTSNTSTQSCLEQTHQSVQAVPDVVEQHIQTDDDVLQDEDFVLVKGPVYIHKSIVDSNLIVHKEQERSDSACSNRTFTIERCQQDKGVQFELDLPLNGNSCMDNIMELTRTAYSQFLDIKLLDSDYDLTPEKENKYHHLMTDASTSLTGIKLMSDDYLVTTKVKEDNYVIGGFKSKSDKMRGLSVDVVSQDSSLRSEGEAVPLPWKK